MDPTFSTADEDTCSMANFFSRPVRIASYSWAVGGELWETLDPWTEYFENKRVINRITNFALLRCKLCVKIVLNGNGFYFGRAMVDYSFLPFEDNMTRNRELFPMDLVEASQRPHIFLDPTTSRGGDLCLPFLWKNNALSIPQGEWGQMGTLTFRSMQPLRHANGGSSNIEISVFAWAEDVSLSVPTSADPASLVPQAGDEFSEKPTISTAAQVVSKVASKLSSIPAIRPYALATTMVADGVGSIAKAFGYSRVKLLDAKTDVRPNPFGTMAPVNDSDIYESFAFDAKQQVTIDSRVIGLDGTDEMAIAPLLARESFLDSFRWPLDSGQDVLLCTLAVTPSIHRTFEVLPGTTELHLPACASVSAPFMYWRGSMRYRFQFASSTFHKGRLRFVYEPFGEESIEWNINYTHVLDLAEERDVTIEIGWGSPFTYLPTLQIGAYTLPVYSMNNLLGPATLLSPDQAWNGTLSVYVVNELTSPNPTINDPVWCNVFVSAGENMQVQVLDDAGYGGLQIYPPPLEIGNLVEQSGDAGADVIDDVHDNVPVHPRVVRLMATRPSNKAQMDMVVFGESPTSIRQVIKRYCTCGGYTPVAFTTKYKFFRWRLADFPPNTGYNTSGWYTYNGVQMEPGAVSLLHYYTRMYVARRGAIRHRVVLVQDTGNLSIANYIPFLVVERMPRSTAQNSASIESEDLVQCTMQVQQAIGSGGMQLIPQLNSVAAYETPYYTNARFYCARNATATGPTYNTYHEIRGCLPAGGTFPGNIMPVRTIAAGEDYSLHMFVGSPVLYRYTTVFS